MNVIYFWIPVRSIIEDLQVSIVVQRKNKYGSVELDASAT